MSKKRKKVSVPKRLAGVKIPKPVRRSLRSFAGSQDGRTILGEALLAAGAAIAANQARDGSATRAAIGKHAPRLKAKARDKAAAIRGSAASVGLAFEAASRAFTEALRRGEPMTPENPPASPG